MAYSLVKKVVASVMRGRQTRNLSGGFTLGTGPQIVARPPNCGYVPEFSRTLNTLWSIYSQKKLVNLMPPGVRF